MEKQPKKPFWWNFTSAAKVFSNYYNISSQTF